MGGELFISCVRSEGLSDKLSLTHFTLEFKGAPAAPQLQPFRNWWQACLCLRLRVQEPRFPEQRSHRVNSVSPAEKRKSACKASGKGKGLDIAGARGSAVQAAWGLDAGRTLKQVSWKFPPFPQCLSYRHWLPTYLHPGIMTFPVLNLKSDRKYAGVSVGETRGSGMTCIAWLSAKTVHPVPFLGSKFQ